MAKITETEDSIQIEFDDLNEAITALCIGDYIGVIVDGKLKIFESPKIRIVAYLDKVQE
jgi:GH15 family glucan-1,4-alpha-glucosidase